jgi:transcriptional regulator
VTAGAIGVDKIGRDKVSMEQVSMEKESLGLIRGTLDLLILQALSAGAKHGYAVSEWIGSVTDGCLLVEEGTLYPALYRLERRRLVATEWGLSDNNRRAKYYRLTAAGRKRLSEESRTWRRYSEAIAKALAEESAS